MEHQDSLVNLEQLGDQDNKASKDLQVHVVTLVCIYIFPRLACEVIIRC